MTGRYPRIEQLPDGRYQATCSGCGWESMPARTRNVVDDARHRHGSDIECAHRHGVRL
jgi:hypothetical protein